MLIAPSDSSRPSANQRGSPVSAVDERRCPCGPAATARSSGCRRRPGCSRPFAPAAGEQQVQAAVACRGRADVVDVERSGPAAPAAVAVVEHLEDAGRRARRRSRARPTTPATEPKICESSGTDHACAAVRRVDRDQRARRRRPGRRACRSGRASASTRSRPGSSDGRPRRAATAAGAARGTTSMR